MAVKLNSLTPVDIDELDRVFNNGGYVLDFTNQTFTSFFNYYDIDIDDEKYSYYGSSKGKRFRRFLELESDKQISEILKELIKKLSDSNDIKRVDKIIQKLSGKQTIFEKDLNIENDINCVKENLYKYSHISDILSYRLDEIVKSYNAGCYFSVIILCGSVLEGILLSIASMFPKEFNQAKSSPKKENKPKKFDQWKLADYIEVAREIKYIDEVAYKYSHNLREFRNFIHPFEAYTKQHSTFDKRSAEISIKVLIKIIEDLDNKTK